LLKAKKLKMEKLAQEIVGLLKQKGLTLGAVESATGGLISYLITSVPGSSHVYLGSVTSYNNDIKIRIIGVKEASIEKYGAVSAPVARQMAEGGRKLLGVDICVADTGIAGPGGATPTKPLGLFYIGLAAENGVHSKKHVFNGTREENQRTAALTALARVKEYLKGIT
jgi:nicotinamide-nucleotide amidase